MSPFPNLGLFLVLLQLFAFCNAQTSKIFQWKFTSSVSTSLPSCQELPITIQPFDPKNVTGSRGVAPYYMLSFALNGLPKTDLIGTDLNSLKWTVNHTINTEIMLSVVDSTGSAGGIPPQLYTVVPGQSTRCIQTASAKSDFTVSGNVTGPLNTCQPWGLRIKGGVPPYSVTLAALSSPVVTNVTLSPVDDAFTYINRAEPNTKLLAAVSDFTGRWAFGTPIVPTQGSTDADCPALNSLGGNTANLEKQAQEAVAAQAAAASRKRASLVAGVVVPIILLVLIGAGAWYWFVYRRRKLESDPEKGINPFSTPTTSVPEAPEMPYPTYGAPGQVLSINSFIDSSPQSPQSMATSPSQHTTSSLPYTSEPASRPMSRRTASTSSGGRPGFAAFPRASTRGSQKAIEAGMSSPDLETSGAEIVIQHKDGGTVRELPPPYMNPTTPRP